MCVATFPGFQKRKKLFSAAPRRMQTSMKSPPLALPEAPSKYAMDNFSPVGLHVIVVDDDPLCLLVLERMLKSCSYKDILRDSEDDIDLVLSDVYMPDVDGFKLLEIIGLELDLPVIMMSANGHTSVVMKGITHGACDYLIKPIRMEDLRNIWQHVVRKKGIELPLCSNTESTSSSELLENSFKKRKEVSIMGQCLVEDASILKRARVNWTVDLHQRFVNAVNQLGVEKAVPKKVLDVMNVEGLTRENVASHLQKYRLYLKRLSGVMPERRPIASFQASEGGKSGGTMCISLGGRSSSSVPAMKELNLRAGITESNVGTQNLDAGTMRSLTGVNALQQQQQRSANRAQVLDALGYVDSCPVAAAPRNASLDMRPYLQVMQSHLLSTSSLPSSLGGFAQSGSQPLKLEDEMGARPQVEGFVSHWNINPVGKHDLIQRAASADAQTQGSDTNLQGNPVNLTSGDMRHACCEGKAGRYVEISDNTNLSQDITEANLDVSILSVSDYLLDEESLFDNGGSDSS